MNDPQDIRTLREWLDSLGGVDRVEVSTGLDIDKVRTLAPQLALDGGRIFINCGGEVILSFPTAERVRWHYYLVRDDSAGQRWQVLRNRGEETETSYRPSPRVRLVIGG